VGWAATHTLILSHVINIEFSMAFCGVNNDSYRFLAPNSRDVKQADGF